MKLEVEVERLYALFRRYRRPLHVDGCEHCVSEADHSRLFRAPLAELQPEDLRRYAFKAMSTWGGAEDFKHYLPRILELVATGELGVDPPIAVGKLSTAKWETWPADEKDAVRAVLRSWWCEARVGDAWTVMDCLASIARVEPSVGPYLDAWWSDDRAAARQSMLGLLADVAPDLLKDRKVNAFWDDGGRQLEDWFSAPDKLEALLRDWTEAPASYRDYPMGELLERWADRSTDAGDALN